MKSGDVIYTSAAPGSIVIYYMWQVMYVSYDIKYVSYVIAGALLKVWVGGYCSAPNELALLACVALNGFHSVVQYCWRKDENIMPGEDKPLLVAGAGTYECSVAYGSLTLTRKFFVSG